MINTFNALEEADEYKMIPAGREDLDVRMLGEGRPFVMEIKNCSKKCLPLDKLKDKSFTSKFLKDDLELGDVYTTDKSALTMLKEGAEEKTKTYKAVIWLSEPLTDQDIEKVNTHLNFTVHQKTPVRVLHRRAGLVRDKIIHKMNIKGIPGNRHFATIELHTQAGTYIKEFVHGDFGRTNPSLSSVLGYQVDIVQLDVTSVEMEFNPVRAQ
jgi:tRNA pseudouridine synthase 10